MTTSAHRMAASPIKTPPTTVLHLHLKQYCPRKRKKVQRRMFNDSGMFKNMFEPYEDESALFLFSFLVAQQVCPSSVDHTSTTIMDAYPLLIVEFRGSYEIWISADQLSLDLKLAPPPGHLPREAFQGRPTSRRDYISSLTQEGAIC